MCISRWSCLYLEKHLPGVLTGMDDITPPDYCEEQGTLIIRWIHRHGSLPLSLSVSYLIFFLLLARKLPTYKPCVYFVRFILSILFSFRCIHIFIFGAYLFIASLWEYKWFLLMCPETLINGLISSRGFVTSLTFPTWTVPKWEKFVSSS